jgi:predicted HTH transcriptional regulator
MATKTSEAYAEEFRKALDDVDSKLKPLQKERERLSALLAAAEGKLKPDSGDGAASGTRTRKASVPLSEAKNKVAHRVSQNPNKSGAYYRKELDSIPGSTVDKALAKLVAEKKLAARGEKRGRTYAPLAS